MTQVYAAVADAYRASGWQGVLPVRGKKEGLPPGFTGRDGTWPGDDQVSFWKRNRAADNVCIRVPDTIIGIDVDAYDGRNGLQTLAHFESQFGSLPLTWRSTSRPRGEGSGIMWFRVPPGVKWVSDLGRDSNVEIVQWGHRYAVVWPSVHPNTGEVYRWYEPGGELSSRVPSPEDLPELPESWAEALRKGNQRRDSNGDGDESDHDGERVDPERVLAGVPIGEQETELFRYICRMRARNYSKSEAVTLATQAVANMRNQEGRAPWTGDDVREKVDRVWREFNPGTAREQLKATPAMIEWARSVGGNQEATTPSTSSTPSPGEAPSPEARNADDVSRTTLPEPGTPDNPFRVTDRANGIEIARFLDKRAVWVPEAKREWQWYVFDGKRWVSDLEKVTMLLIGEFADSLRRFANEGNIDDGERDVLRQRATRIESTQGLGGALKWAAPHCVQSITTFDVDPWLLNCPNGILDLRTGKLSSHGPEHLLTRLCPTPYDEDARDEVWEKVLRESVDDDPDRMRFLARFAGYTLTGITSEKKFIVPNGPANTGKSTITEALYNTLGDVADGGYATVWDADVVQAGILVNRGEKLAKSRPARMVLVGELAKGSRMADNFVKQFTGGDTMDARALYEGSFSYRPQAKLWMATNYIPASADPALHVRLLPVPFRHVPSRIDPGIKRHLDTNVNAHKAILAWAVRSGMAWQKERSLGKTPWYAAEMKRYSEDSDAIAQFIAECLVQHTDGWKASATPDELWQVYAIWSAHYLNPKQVMSRRILEQALKERTGSEKKRGEGGGNERRWVGLRVRSPEEHDD